ncbi:MAG: ribonuclease P protein component 1 [Nanobdellota archaeon]
MKKIDVDMLYTDLIGKYIIVKDSKNPSVLHLEGEIIDETKHTVLVQTDTTRRRLIKDQCTFTIKNHKTMTIPGSKLCGRPEERLKKWFRKKRKLGSR